MKKLLLILLCFPMIGFGQIIFSEITGTSFIGVEESSVKFSDIDGDGDEDILITGRDVNNTAVFNVYANDGIGNFSMITGLVFDGVYQSALVTLDIDGDSDLDVLVSGRSQSQTCITKLYENDGIGNFNEVLGTSFIGVRYCSIAFSDIDSDNDYDVLISGQDCNGFSITKLYINDGIGNFNEVPGTSFIGVHFCSIAFSDVDGDNDQDILITGYTQNALLVSKLYTNDGSGNFTEVTGFPVIGLAESSIAFSDVDGDNDEDLFVTGWAQGWIETSKLYINDGLGNFSEPSGTSFIGVTEGDVLFLDVDCDNDQDILYTGYNGGFKIIKLYKNDGNLLFNNVTGLSLSAVEYCSIASSDIDNDNDNDLLITGEIQGGSGITKLYRNNTCSGSSTYGCTDTLAYNYDSTATIDDSSCVYPIVWQQTYLICDGDTLYVGTNAYSSPGYYVDSLLSTQGYDSIIHTILTVYPILSSNEYFNICQGDSVIVGLNVYNSPGNYIDTLASGNGCDSIVYTNVSMPSIIWYQTYLICDGDSIVVGSSVYDTAGAYMDTLNASNGCDSIVHTYIAVDQNTSSYDTLSVAASIVWNGMPLNVSGDYSVTLINSVGCDSIVNLNLTVTTTGISEIANNKSNLVKITDILGRETQPQTNTPLFYIYDDGTVEKRIVVK